VVEKIAKTMFLVQNQADKTTEANPEIAIEKKIKIEETKAIETVTELETKIEIEIEEEIKIGIEALEIIEMEGITREEEELGVNPMTESKFFA
jgi:hypothetical protein